MDKLIQKRYMVNFVDTISGDLKEAKSRTYSTLEDATDFVYEIQNNYDKVSVSSERAERYRTFIEIEEIVTTKIFIKELTVKEIKTA